MSQRPKAFFKTTVSGALFGAHGVVHFRTVPGQCPVTVTRLCRDARAEQGKGAIGPAPTAPYCAEGRPILPSEARGWSEKSRMPPNAWTFGVP